LSGRKKRGCILRCFLCWLRLLLISCLRKWRFILGVGARRLCHCRGCVLFAQD
jgi:hypothetical protein